MDLSALIQWHVVVVAEERGGGTGRTSKEEGMYA